MTKNDVPEVLELLPEIEKLGGKIIKGEEIPNNHGIIGIKQQNLVFFPNGYGASIIRDHSTRDLQLYIIKVLDEDNDSIKIWHLCYDNFTLYEKCSFGYLDECELIEILEVISKIDPQRQRKNNFSKAELQLVIESLDNMIEDDVDTFINDRKDISQHPKMFFSDSMKEINRLCEFRKNLIELRDRLFES